MDQETGTESVVTEYFEGYQQLEKEGIEENLNKSRNAIFAVAVLAVVGALILFSTNKVARADLVFNLGLSAVYLVLAFMTRKFPMACVVSALILFAGTWILNIVVGGMSQVFQGIIVRGIILYYLIKGIGYAKEAVELKSRMNPGQ